MDIDDLTLTSIDAHRHLTTSEAVVSAVAFAARRGHSDVTAYRFVTVLVMLDQLQPRKWWARTLGVVRDLEIEKKDQHVQ